MPNNLWRLLATVAIWGAVTTIIITLSVTGGYLGFIELAVVMGTAAGATIPIWASIRGEQGAIYEAEKSKRRSRVDRLLDGMSERELDELRSRLGADGDGELLTLDEILAERRRR